MLLEYTIDFYAMKLSAPGLYFMYHIGQASIPTSVKTMTHFIDDIETFLTVRDIFREFFMIKLCNPKEQSTKVSFKCDYLHQVSINLLAIRTMSKENAISYILSFFISSLV
jgi:hypothetical protein